MSNAPAQQPAAKWIVAAKFEQVQTYLLRSPRLRQIRGGSRLLVRLESNLRHLAASRGGEVCCAAGGIFLAQVDAEDDARDVLAGVRSSIAATAPALRYSATMGSTSEDPSRFGADLRVLLEEPDRAGAGVTAAPDLAAVLPCDVCRRRPARAFIDHGGDRLRACDDCLARHAADRDQVETLEHEVPDQFTLTERVRRGAPTVDDLSRAARPPGYLAYVAADGNAVGGRLNALQSCDDFRRFSEALDRATRRATGVALQACSAYPSLAGTKVVPAIVGGDDIIVFTSPRLGVPLAVEFAAAFEKATKELVGDTITTSVGVVIAHASTPFASLDQAAHVLQKRAKRLSRQRDGASMVAWRLLASGSDVAPEQAAPGRTLGLDAYTAAEARALVDTAFAAAAAEDVPASRLKEIDRLLRRTDAAASSDYRLLVGADSMASIRPGLAAAEALPAGSDDSPLAPWRLMDGELVTALPDLVALVEVAS